MKHYPQFGLDKNLKGRNISHRGNWTWNITFREALNCIWVWRNDQLHNPNNSVPSTPYLIRDIICRANHILTNVYLLDDFDGISPDYPDATQGSFL